MKLNRKMMALAAVFALVLSSAALVSANKNVSEMLAQKKAAIVLARTEMPADVNYLGTKDEVGKYCVMGQDPLTLQYYTIRVDMKTNKITDVEIKGSNYPGSATITKSEADIKAAVLAKYPNAKNIVIALEKDPNASNLSAYKATFEAGRFNVESLLNPHTAFFGYQFLKAI